MKNLTIRSGDKSAAWTDPGSHGLEPLDAMVLIIHNDNLDAFLQEHSITLTPAERELATRDKTDTIAMFGKEGLDFVLLSPPDDTDCKRVWVAKKRTLPLEAYQSLLLRLYC